MDDCYCFQSATGLTPEFNTTTTTTNVNVDLSGITATINANFEIYSNNSNIDSSNISNLYYNDKLLNSNISNLYLNNGSNISNVYYNTGFIDSNLLWWRYELQGTQLELVNQKANQAILSAQ